MSGERRDDLDAFAADVAAFAFGGREGSEPRDRDFVDHDHSVSVVPELQFRVTYCLDTSCMWLLSGETSNVR